MFSSFIIIGLVTHRGWIFSFTAVPAQEESDYPKFIETSPKHGPVSGGTNITIKGRNLDKYGGIVFLYIGNMKLPIKNWTRYSTSFTCKPNLSYQ